MAAVAMDITQSGSGSTEIHAELGDTVTFLLESAVNNNVLAAALAPADMTIRIADVTFAFSTAGDGAYPLTITQSGSGTTAIDAAAADVIKIKLASVVENNVLAAFVAYLQALTPITGVIFQIDTAGNAS